MHKVRSGQTIQGAVEDIVRRDVGELRKNAFGDDAEDAKGLPWSREQAWQLFKQLTKKEEVRACAFYWYGWNPDGGRCSSHTTTCSLICLRTMRRR